MTKVTNTHSEYVILIDFPEQQWLGKRVSTLCYSYIGCLVSYLLHTFAVHRNINNNAEA